MTQTSLSGVQLVACAAGRHALPILDILNEAIQSSTAVYDYQPRSPESMVGWFAAKRDQGLPVIGVEDSAGVLMGFGTFGVFRNWPAYKYSVEHSIYIHKDNRRKGLGGLLLRELIAQAQARDKHLMIGGIDATNDSSIRLHEREGFTHAGTVRQAGFKFGRWLDLAFYQLLLPTPRSPMDG